MKFLIVLLSLVSGLLGYITVWSYYSTGLRPLTFTGGFLFFVLVTAIVLQQIFYRQYVEKAVPGIGYYPWLISFVTLAIFLSGIVSWYNFYNWNTTHWLGVVIPYLSIMVSVVCLVAQSFLMSFRRW